MPTYPEALPTDLLALATRVAGHLKSRGESIAVAESSTGGMIAAALLAVPGASAYFLGGAVVYTALARRALLDVPDSAMAGIRSASEPYAGLLATTVRRRFAADWGLSETGATGPTGNRYGDAAGHCCIGVARADGVQAFTLETGSTDRQANMNAFAKEALGHLLGALERA
jgi:nicotinamide-nucleotide amidase